MVDSWQQPYLPPPVPKRSFGFWKIATSVVLAGLVIFAVMAIFSRNRNEPTPTASSVDALQGTEPETVSTVDPQSDLDQDGLVQTDEERYGTNPNDRDTDKDGYSDGEEVNNGYNPNGSGRLSLEAPTDVSTTTEDPNRRTLVKTPEQTGVPLAQVYAGSGSYVCRITGGTSEENTVTVKVREGQVRQETPINGTTLVMIVRDQKDFYMSGFEGGKFLKLLFNPQTGEASGQGASVRGGIFASESLVLGSNPNAIACEESSLTESEFTVAADQLINP